MNYKIRSKKKTVSIQTGLATGTLSALIILLCSIAMLAKLVDSKIVSEENTKYGILILLLTTSFMASSISYGKIKRQRVVICAASGAIYFLILASIPVLIFGAEYAGVPETAVLIFCGSAVAILPGFHPENRIKSSKIKIPNC